MSSFFKFSFLLLSSLCSNLLFSAENNILVAQVIRTPRGLVAEALPYVPGGEGEVIVRGIPVSPRGERRAEVVTRAVPVATVIRHPLRGLPPLNRPIRRQVRQTFKRLPNKEEMFKYAKRGDLQSIKVFLPFFDKIDMQDEAGNTLLHYAASYGQAEVVQYLLSQGADHTVKNFSRNPQNPLQLAMTNGQEKVKRILLQSHGLRGQARVTYWKERIRKLGTPEVRCSSEGEVFPSVVE